MNPEYLQVYHENRLKLTFFEFVLLVLIYQKQADTLQACYDDDYIGFMKMIENLEDRGYVKWHGSEMDDFTLRTKADDLFKKITGSVIKGADVHIWIDTWRELFPEGVNSGGYRYRGNRLEVLQKMIKFVSSHPYSKDEIFEATKQYVNRFSLKNYNYMQIAHYFIQKKDVGSTLESECESLRNSGSKPEEKSPNYGRNVR